TDDEADGLVYPPHPTTDATDALWRVKLVRGSGTVVAFAYVRSDPGTHTGYAVALQSYNGGGQIRRLNGRYDSTSLDLNASFRPSPFNEDVWVRFQADGDTLRAKAWAVGDPEPSEWGLE